MKKNKIIAALAAISLFFAGPLSVLGERELEIIEFEEVEETDQETTVSLDTGTSSNYIDMGGVIQNNIYLDTINLSGLTKEEALLVAHRRMEEVTGYPIVLQVEDQKVSVPAKELGVVGVYEHSIDEAVQYGKAGNLIKRYKIQEQLKDTPVQLSFEYQVDETVLTSTLETQSSSFNREAVDYDLVKVNSGFEIIPGQNGIVLDVEKSADKLVKYFTNDWKDGIGYMELEAEIVQPKGSVEELSRVTTIIGQGGTDYSSSGSGRKKNVETASSKLRGVLLYPGETISVCGTIVPFTEENGYAMAASYENGTVVQSMGGGICQVSTTLYLAVLRAELEIVERYNHSMIVNYVKPAMDAAIAEGVKDFKFKNNLDAPIYIHSYADGSTVYFAIYGEEYRDENRTVKYESEVVETIEPTTELVANREAAFGTVKKIQSSHTGYSAKLWKNVTIGDEVTRELVNTSYYRMSPSKYEVGVITSNLEAETAMLAAISSGDLAQVYNIIDLYGRETEETESVDDEV